MGKGFEIKTILCDSIEELDDEINNCYNDGWQPWSQVVVVMVDNGKFIQQLQRFKGYESALNKSAKVIKGFMEARSNEDFRNCKEVYREFYNNIKYSR